jgi:hypothetical protein
MKTISNLIILAGVAATLAACGNPIDRESNPVKNYDQIKKDIPIQQYEQEKQVYCGNSYLTTIRTLNETGGEVDTGTNLSFLVGEPKSYRIYVQDNQQLNLTLGSAPEGMELTKISNIRWDLHWQPKASDGGATDKVRVLATAVGKTCQSTDINDLTVTVNTGSLQPTIAITGIDANKTYGSSDRISFMVNVTDPSLTTTSTPDAPTFEFPTQDSKTGTKYITAKNIVQCGSPQVMPGPWEFRVSCAFNVDQIVAQNLSVQGLHITEMIVNVKSTTGEAANPYPVKVTVNFPAPAIQPKAANPPTVTGEGK